MLPTVDTLRNLLVVPTTEMLSFFQQFRGALFSPVNRLDDLGNYETDSARIRKFFRAKFSVEAIKKLLT